MSIDSELEGRTYPSPGPYAVGREKVREFARATLSTQPQHTDVEAARAAGYADVVAPVTFPIVIAEATLAQLLADDEVGIDFSRVVHGDQRFTYTRPLVAGDVITPTLTIAKVRSLGGHDMITTDAVMTDEAGAHVVTATCTLVVRGAEEA